MIASVSALPIHRRISDTLAGIKRLGDATRSWTAFAPSVAGVDATIAQADAVARALRELRPVIVADIGPQPPKAA